MNRLTATIKGCASVALALAIVGCGGGGGTKVDLGKADLAMGGGGGDMAMGGGGDVDMAQGPVGKATGEPCKQNTDCAKGNGTNQNPVCLKATGQAPNQLMWPEGYCMTPCRPTKNDLQTGLNSDCPGDNATCLGSGQTGECRASCMSSADCRQPNYACFSFSSSSHGCLPKAVSECNPLTPGTCFAAPRMKKCGAPKPDGGACYEDTCVNIGDGTVGACVPGCNPFENDIKKNGCSGTDNSVDCHASDVTGEGLCTNANQTMATHGSPCGNFYSDCGSGMGCKAGKCWNTCNTANAATRCDPGAKCEAFTKTVNGMKVPVDKLGTGICTKSSKP